MTARLIMKMRVAEAHTEPGDVRVLTLRHPWRTRLAEPSPGAHVDLRLPDGKIRQYSLCGDPDDLSQYRIAVKREENGRGGSRWVHDRSMLAMRCMFRRRETIFRWQRARPRTF